MKFLILIIAVCYVHSSPVLVDKAIASDVNKVETTSKIESTQPIESAPSSVSIQKVEPVALVNEEDKKLVRTARDNKIEYVYVNADGQILPNQKDYVDRSALISHSLDELSTNRQDKVASSTKEPTNVNNKDPSASVNSKDWVPSSDSKESTSEKASDALHYSSSGGFKVRSENVKSRLSNALPSTATVSNPSGLAQNSPTISALYPSQLNQAYSSNDVLNLQNPSIPSFSSYTPSLSYPLLLQSVYNPYMVNGASLLPSLSSSNYLTSSPSSLVARTTANLSPILSPEEVEVRRVLLAQVSPNINYLSGRLVSPLSTNNYLYGRTLSSLIIPQHQYTSQVVNSNPIVQQSTPFSDYLLPQQQSPNLISRTSLNNNNLGFGGLTSLDYGTNGLNVASSGLLLPQSLPLTQSLPMSQSYSTVLPQSIAYIPLIVPQQHQYTPQVVNSNPIVQQSSQPSVVVQPPITTTADYTPRRTVITTTETTTNNAQPFTDSITATSNSGPLILPGITENETIEKPLFYASQNAALRLSSPYDSTLYSGIYPNRLIDSNFNSLPITTAYLPRYQTSNYYSRLAYPYSSTGYSYSRPLIAPYPSIYHSGQLYGPYNGVGYVSPMHYSADTSSILSKKAEETTKPVVKDQVVDKSNNLMYTIKTSKSESKETVSRLNDANKIRDDDKKAA